MHHATLLSRRAVLQFGLSFGVCACFFPSRLLAAAPTRPDPERSARIAAGFAGIVQGAQAWLTQAVGPQEAAAVARACPETLARLLPRMPDLGPANRNEVSLEEAVWLTALTQAMRARKLPEAMAGRLFFDLCAQELDEQLADAKAARALAEAGAAMFTAAGREELRAWTTETQKRSHPADWVGTAVFGNGQDFDLGYDYSECGALKFFRAQGVGAVAPYFCLNDFTLSKAQGTGLARVHTLAQGDRLCDFRHKQGRPVTQGWDSETPRFAKSSA